MMLVLYVGGAAGRRAAWQSIPAIDIDAATARLVLDLMTPMAIENDVCDLARVRSTHCRERANSCGSLAPATSASVHDGALCWLPILPLTFCQIIPFKSAAPST